MKITIDRKEDQYRVAIQERTHAGKQKRFPWKTSPRVLYVAFILAAMIAAVLFLDAALPLRNLWFHDALLTQMGAWPVLPSLLIFHGRALLPHLPFKYVTMTPGLLEGWFEIAMLFVAFLAVFSAYLLALRRLPGAISKRFILWSTVGIGCLYMLIPVVTSPDLFSYIAYARMAVLHNLNPLTTIPTAIQSDPVYKYIFWVDQPSAYGPTWAVYTVFLQWILLVFKNTYILPMVLALRGTGLVMHLISTRLVWSISGQVQQLNGQPVLATRKRIRATLAFAWNPLLLFEACVNAHNDAMLVVFVLLTIWVLAREKIRKMQANTGEEGTQAMPEVGGTQAKPGRGQTIPGRGQTIPGRGQAPPLPYYENTLAFLPYRVGAGLAPALVILQRTARTIAPLLELLLRPLKNAIARIPLDARAPLAAACLLALGTCLKINAVLFLPVLLCYIWMQAPPRQRLKQSGITIAMYIAVIVLFYAPFWQGGAIFNVFRVNPATNRTINTFADFLAHSYNTVAGLFGNPSGAPVGSPAEHFMHTFSTGIFVLIFLVMLWRMLRAPEKMRSLRSLIYWMAAAWIIYCAIGSPWFWPWYLATFFGLFALLEATDAEPSVTKPREIFPWRLWFMRTPWAARIFSFSMLTLYCLITGPSRNFVHGLPGFQWSDFAGAWAWVLPLAGSALLLKWMPSKEDATSKSLAP